MVVQRKRIATPRKRRQAAESPWKNHPLMAYVNAHCEWMLMKGYTETTVEERLPVFQYFIAWCDERGITQVTDITRHVLERYQRHLFYHRKPNGEPLTIGTQHSRLAPLKTWFKWLAKQNHILYNPASELELPKLPKRLPRSILNIQEVEAIMAEANPDTAEGLRDRAMLEVLYSTGLRRMELAGLALYDVDVHRGVVFVREGKGRKDRVVPIGERALAWVDRYLVEARPQFMTVEHDTLFVNDYGEPIGEHTVVKKVKHHIERAGIKKTGATHLFRHTMATHMLEAGADIRILQAILGHAKLTTTEIYTHVSIEHLKAIHTATHPAKLKRDCTEADLLAALALEDDEEIDNST